MDKAHKPTDSESHTDKARVHMEGNRFCTQSNRPGTLAELSSQRVK
jgi:hypothetical protein